ncbi:hypothetical protein H5P36_04560 [Bacillus sp. APMAM]|nr:hypothetical protein [Bacillus sp. APMAM]RTZ56978.1 hypothetical protein EKO25_04755 [Bacillus sp. SAJ1]
MNLTQQQQTVLLALTTEWQSPRQISEQLSHENGDLSTVNQSLKELMREGLVQTNPLLFGLYRLTAQGVDTKVELDKDQ